MIYTVTLNPALDRELQVARLAFDTVLRADGLQVDWGGKGFNVSRLLQKLGAESVAVGFVGGPTGQQLQAGLESLGLRTDFVPIQGETRTNVSVVSLAEGRHLKVNEAGPHILPSEVAALRAKVRSLARAGDWWVLAGSLPPGVSPQIYAELVELVQAGGGRAIVDTSGPALRAVLTAQPYLIKPNAAEASELTGLPITSPAEALQAAQVLQAQGLERILISLGAEGAVLRVGDEHWFATPPPISEANPIGAGDSTVGGLVYALSRSLGWAEVLRWSMACGAATASLPGTTVGDLAMVEALLGKVGVGE